MSVFGMPAFIVYMCCRLQQERKHLEQWLRAAEEKAVKEENLNLLQEDALQQR